MNVKLLKQILSVPTFYGEEDMLVLRIQEELRRLGIPYYTDRLHNIYATKGNTDQHYPMVCAHTDSVHPIQGEIGIHEHNGVLYGKTKDGKDTGCGGDDKAGVFVCLEMLKHFDVMKAAFFVSEEIGCRGSAQADETFFHNVAYCIEWDSPNDDIMSYSCDGVPLFESQGMFIRSAQEILDEHGVTKWQRHPFTDVAMLRRRFNIECLNLPPGYFHMHTDQEFVKLATVENALHMGRELIRAIPHRQYLFDSRIREQTTVRKITGLDLGYR